MRTQRRHFLLERAVLRVDASATLQSLAALWSRPMSAPSHRGALLSRAAPFGLLLLACVGGSSRGTPLYPDRGQPPSITEVAQLVGDIETVDGKSVRGRSFELLPGCHVVTTPTSWGQHEQYSTMSGNLPKHTFVINMQPNRSYVLEYELTSRTGNGGNMVLHAFEQDAAGTKTAGLAPVSEQADIDKCMAQNTNERRRRR